MDLKSVELLNILHLGCNSDKKSDFQNLKVATLYQEITVHLTIRFSGNFRMS